MLIMKRLTRLAGHSCCEQKNCIKPAHLQSKSPRLMRGLRKI